MRGEYGHARGAARGAAARPGLLETQRERVKSACDVRARGVPLQHRVIGGWEHTRYTVEKKTL